MATLIPTDFIVAGPPGYVEAAYAGHFEAGPSGHFTPAPAGHVEIDTSVARIPYAAPTGGILYAQPAITWPDPNRNVGGSSGTVLQGGTGAGTVSPASSGGGGGFFGASGGPDTAGTAPGAGGIAIAGGSPASQQQSGGALLASQGAVVNAPLLNVQAAGASVRFSPSFSSILNISPTVSFSSQSDVSINSNPQITNVEGNSTILARSSTSVIENNPQSITISNPLTASINQFEPGFVPPQVVVNNRQGPTNIHVSSRPQNELTINHEFTNIWYPTSADASWKAPHVDFSDMEVHSRPEDMTPPEMEFEEPLPELDFSDAAPKAMNFDASLKRTNFDDAMPDLNFPAPETPEIHLDDADVARMLPEPTRYADTPRLIDTTDAAPDVRVVVMPGSGGNDGSSLLLDPARALEQTGGDLLRMHA